MKGVTTAGAFLRFGDRWVFVTGPTRGGERLCITRLGGHREQGESPWECVQREVLEEGGVRIEHLPPPASYRYELTTDEITRQEWGGSPAPLAVAASSDGALTPLYLARSEHRPVPSAETQGLLFLTSAEIEGLLTAPMTLQAHLEAGGMAFLRPGFPTTLPLEPFYHIRLLKRILTFHPELA